MPVGFIGRQPPPFLRRRCCCAPCCCCCPSNYKYPAGVESAGPVLRKTGRLKLAFDLLVESVCLYDVSRLFWRGGGGRGMSTFGADGLRFSRQSPVLPKLRNGRRHLTVLLCVPIPQETIGRNTATPWNNSTNC